MPSTRQRFLSRGLVFVRVTRDVHGAYTERGNAMRVARFA
jgi:hypothetical protein